MRVKYKSGFTKERAKLSIAKDGKEANPASFGRRRELDEKQRACAKIWHTLPLSIILHVLGAKKPNKCWSSILELKIDSKTALMQKCKNFAVFITIYKKFFYSS